MIQGQSQATLWKEVLISTCVGWSLKQLGSFPGPYFVFDLNCGSGENRRNGANAKGTPLIMKGQFEKRAMSAKMYFCDKSRKALKLLERHFECGQLDLFQFQKFNITPFFIRSNNRLFVPTIPERIREAGVNPRMAHGVIIADPNGIEIPLKEIAACLWECPRLDVLIHLGHAPQCFAQFRKNPDFPIARKRPETIGSIRQIFNMIPRTWLLTAPFRKGGDDHIVLFGSHRPWVPEIKNKPFMPDMISVKSAEGQRIVASIDGLEVA